MLVVACHPAVPGIAAPGGPVAQLVPQTWRTVVVDQEFQNVTSVLIATPADRSSGRAEFMRHFEGEQLRRQLAEAIDQAPADNTVYGGMLDNNCSPGHTPVVLVRENIVVLKAADKSGDQGECAVHWTSYAIVALEPGALASAARTTG